MQNSEIFLIPPVRDPPHPSRPNLLYNPAMPMTPFVERFPELGARETRSLTVTGRTDLPDGDYGFLELYCNEPHCDCRRVMVVVLRPETGWNKFWATINYGWESLGFYQKWARAPASDRLLWQGPFLDPVAAQTPYSPVLLDLFKVILQSPDYVQRLKKHYQLFRAAVEDEFAKRNETERSQVGHRSTRRQGPKRSG